MKHKSKNFLSSAADAYNNYKPKAQGRISQVYDSMSMPKENKGYIPPLTSYINPVQNAKTINDTTNKNYKNTFDKNMADEYRKAVIKNINRMDSTKQKKHGGSIKNKK